MTDLKEVSSNRCFDGWQKVYSHTSNELKCSMNFAIYVPDNVDGRQMPVLYYLSGLTCNEQNMITKAGFQQHAAKHKLVVVCPDTSPRGVNIPGEDDAYDFGSGAGFYVDATQSPWSAHYRMYSYVTRELPALIGAHFAHCADTKRQAITGHSMGGHGALVCALRNPGAYKSVSAFAPICNPTQCAWGEKAFTGYLGADRGAWQTYDATELIKTYTGPNPNILIDQGTKDQFLVDQLKPTHFVDACTSAGKTCTLRMQQDYDHSYYFISTFIGNHIEHHAKHLHA